MVWQACYLLQGGKAGRAIIYDLAAINLGKQNGRTLCCLKLLEIDQQHLLEVKSKSSGTTMSSNPRFAVMTGKTMRNRCASA